MNRTEALISSIERDLPSFHRERMAKRQGKQFSDLRAEQAKARPDEARIRKIREMMVSTERAKRDTAITEREVLKPLRERLERERTRDDRTVSRPYSRTMR